MKQTTSFVRLLFIPLLCVGAALWLVPDASAFTTTPLKHVYNGHLLDSSGNAITTAHKIRFSYWTSSDFVSGDVTGTGAIDTGASEYADWQEENTVTPNSDGYFTVNLGETTALPDFSLPGMSTSTLLGLYIQVEVKASGDPDTSYELLDVDTSDTSVDRSSVLSVPFAMNADLIDQREPGTGSGDLLILGSGGIINVTQMGSGTTFDSWTIDIDNTSTTNITLRFGDTLNKWLTYDISNSYFEFNDDVKIDGDLTVNNINGVPPISFAPLYVSSGGGLNVNVNSGSYRVSGNVTDFTGTSSIALTDDAMNYIFFTSTGLTVTTGGFPEDKSIIRLAEVTTAAGTVTSNLDRRVLASDDRERTVERIYHATNEHTAYKADGSSNVGRLFVNHDTSTGSLRNFYSWSSTRPTLQDYDILLRATVSPDFVRWKDNPLTVTYRSTSSDAADNKLDIAVFDTAGSSVTLSGSSTALVSTTFTTTELEFLGSPTWTPGSDFLIRLRPFARSDFEMHVSDVKLKYVDLTKE